MTLGMHDPNRSIVLKDDARDDPAMSADACMRAARLAESIASYAPHPWRERPEGPFEMSGGEDARIQWIQDLPARGAADPAWRTRIQMWEPMPCGDSLRTLQITLPDGIPPDTIRPDGMLDLAGFLGRLSRACRSAREKHPMPWLTHAIAAHATRPFSSGTMVPGCGWLPHRFEGDLADAIPDAAMTMLGRTVPAAIMLSTNVQATEEGMDMHNLVIRPSPMGIRSVDAVTGLRALERFAELQGRAA